MHCHKSYLNMTSFFLKMSCRYHTHPHDVKWNSSYMKRQREVQNNTRVMCCVPIRFANCIEIQCKLAFFLLHNLTGRRVTLTAYLSNLGIQVLFSFLMKS